MAMSQKPSVIRQAFFEAAFVVLGVALAYAANEWRQNKADQVQAQQALAGIVEELESNRSKIDASYQYHDQLFRQLLSLAQEQEMPEIGLFSKGFIHPSAVFESAWETAKTTGASRQFDYPTTLTINHIYVLQQRYQKQGEIVGNLLYEDLYRSGRNAILGRHLLDVISTFLWKEKELLEAYDEAIAKLKPGST